MVIWSFYSSSLSSSLFSSFGVVAHVIYSSCVDVDISLAAFDLSIRRLLSITGQPLDLHHMPVGDKEACACAPISSLQH
jgi:hypothetical protein